MHRLGFVVFYQPIQPLNFVLYQPIYTKDRLTTNEAALNSVGK